MRECGRGARAAARAWLGLWSLRGAGAEPKGKCRGRREDSESLDPQSRKQRSEMMEENLRLFCFSLNGRLKMLRLVMTVISMTLFIVAQDPEPYIVVTGFEAVAVLFFIILYMLRLDHLMDCLFWPLLDIINSVVSAVFILTVSALALVSRSTAFTTLGGVSGCVATAFCTVDAALICRKLRLNQSDTTENKS